MSAMKRKLLTVYECTGKYEISMSHLRLLLGKRSVKGELASITKTRQIWLVDEASLKAYLRTPRTTGPKPKK